MNVDVSEVEKEAKVLEKKELELAYSLSVVLLAFATTSGYIVYQSLKTLFVRSASVHSTMFHFLTPDRAVPRSDHAPTDLISRTMSTVRLLMQECSWP